MLISVENFSGKVGSSFHFCKGNTFTSSTPELLCPLWYNQVRWGGHMALKVYMGIGDGLRERAEHNTFHSWAHDFSVSLEAPIYSCGFIVTGFVWIIFVVAWDIRTWEWNKWKQLNLLLVLPVNLQLKPQQVFVFFFSSKVSLCYFPSVLFPI